MDTEKIVIEFEKSVDKKRRSMYFWDDVKLIGTVLLVSGSVNAVILFVIFLCRS